MDGLAEAGDLQLLPYQKSHSSCQAFGDLITVLTEMGTSHTPSVLQTQSQSSGLLVRTHLSHTSPASRLFGPHGQAAVKRLHPSNEFDCSF